VISSDAISLAVDSAGLPAVAFFGPPQSGNTAELLFWRKGMASGAVKIVTTNDVANAPLDITLRFEGAKPRVAGHFSVASVAAGDAGADAGAAGSSDLIFAASDDGSQWPAPIHVPRNGDAVTGITSALALDGKGAAAIVANTTVEAADAGGSGNPYVALSSDEKTWTPGGADKTNANHYIAASLSAAYGSTGGKLTLGFHNRQNKGGGAPGIVFWRQE
jgi:hypothetical protein